MAKCTNYCIKGSCSSCGNCCTELLPLTISEVKLIKAYVKEKGIKPYSEIFFKVKPDSSSLVKYKTNDSLLSNLVINFL